MFFGYSNSCSRWTPNPDLRPEKGWSYELGCRNRKVKKPWSVSVFYMTMDDKIEYRYDYSAFEGRYTNIDEYRAWGAEAEVTFSLSENWTYAQGIAWTWAEVRNNGGRWTRFVPPRRCRNENKENSQ